MILIMNKKVPLFTTYCSTTKDRHLLLPIWNKSNSPLYIYIKKSFPNQRKFPASKGVLHKHVWITCNEFYHNEYRKIERKIIFCLVNPKLCIIYTLWKICIYTLCVRFNVCKIYVIDLTCVARCSFLNM